jgi:hypothetical protein
MNSHLRSLLEPKINLPEQIAGIQFHQLMILYLQMIALDTVGFMFFSNASFNLNSFDFAKFKYPAPYRRQIYQIIKDESFHLL